MKKKSMSVREMRRLLGLGKTESYWLVKKNYFDTIIIGGKMRVMIESFENWYANQLHYKKIIGEAPGKNWKSITMSIQETARLLGIMRYIYFSLFSGGTYSNRSSILQFNAQHNLAKTAVSSRVTVPLQNWLSWVLCISAR